MIFEDSHDIFKCSLCGFDGGVKHLAVTAWSGREV
jgi:hypothetical protein